MAMTHARLTTIVLFGLAALSLVGSASRCLGEGFPTVVAKEFRLVDDQGRPRAVFGSRDGTVGLFLLGKRQTIRADLVVLPDDSPALLLHGANGVLRAQLVDVGEDTPALALHDREGRDRLILSLFPDGRATIMLLERDGTLQAQLWITEDGVPRLDLATAHRRGHQVRGPESHVHGASLRAESNE